MRSIPEEEEKSEENKIEEEGVEEIKQAHPITLLMLQYIGPTRVVSLKNV